MRRFSKIFAVIMSICMLFGIITATAVYAADQSYDLDITSDGGIKSVMSLDFEEVKNGDVSYAASSSGNRKSDYGWTGSRYNDLIDIVARTQTDEFGMTNNYLQHQRIDGAAFDRNAGYWEYFISRWTTSTARKLSDYSYLTIDFDVCADEYIYTLNGEQHHGTEVPEGATDVYLSYPDLFSFYNILRGPGGSNNDYGFITIVKDGLKWYAVASPSSGNQNSNLTYGKGNSIELYDIAGAWNHFSIVLDIDNVTLGDTKLRVYVNGEILFEKHLNYSAAEFYPDSLRFDTNKTVQADASKFFSYGIDNISSVYYDKDYSSGDDVYGLDDYYAETDHLTTNLSVCEDIVYTSEYSYYGSPTPYDMVIEHTDGSKFPYYSIDTGLKNIKDGDFVTITKDILDFTPNDNVEELTFISSDGTQKLELSAVAREYYKVQHTQDRYTLKLDKTSGLKLNYYSAQGKGSNTKIIKTYNLLPFCTPSADIYDLKIYGKIDVSNPDAPTIEILKKWEIDVDGDGYGDGTEPYSMTVAEMNELREVGSDEIAVVPVFEVKPLEYIVEYLDSNLATAPNLCVSDRNYSKLTAIAELSKALSDIPEGVSVKVTLYTDYENLTSSIVIPAGVTVNFDLNGHSISANGASVFTVNEATELNLYSTKAGAKITGNDIITSKGLDACVINIGEKRNGETVVADGNNISLVGGSLINLKGSSADRPNDNKILITIKGGSYTVSADANGAMFPISDVDMLFDIQNAYLCSTNGTPIFSAVTSVTHSANISISASTVMSLDGADVASIIGTWTNTCNAAVSDSVLIGYNSNATKFVLGDNCKVSGTFNKSGILVSEGVNYARSNNGKTSVTVADTQFEITLITFKTQPENVCTVKWLKPDESVYATEYWVKESGVDFADASVFGIVSGNNDWYDRVYNGWNNKATNTPDQTVTGDVEYIPAANGYVGNLKSYMSVEITDGLTYNVYLPKLPEGSVVTFIGFFDAVGNRITNGVYDNIEEYSYKLMSVVSAADFDATTITVKYSVGGNEFSLEITFDILDYAKKVNEKYGCGTDESKLVYAMLQYKLEAYKKTDGAKETVINKIYSNYLDPHGTNCGCAGDTDYSPETTPSDDLSAVEEKLVGIDYGIVLDNDLKSQYSFAIRFNKDFAVTAVNAKISETVVSNLVRIEHDDCIEYRWSNISLEYLSQAITLTVTVSDSEQPLTCVCSLAGCIEKNDSAFLKALYVLSSKAFAEAAENS